MRWTLRETEDLVRLVHGGRQADLIKPVLRSSVDRLDYATITRQRISSKRTLQTTSPTRSRCSL